MNFKFNLNLAIGEGEVEQMPFHSEKDLHEYIEELKAFKDVVWIMACLDEIVITESIDFIRTILNHFDFKELEIIELHIHEYESYDDAYAVAYDMREGNKLQG